MKYCYRVVISKPEYLEQDINNLAKDGYKLFGVQPLSEMKPGILPNQFINKLTYQCIYEKIIPDA